MVRSTILALLAAAAVATGCGARSEQTADSPAEDAPGILVFSGVTSGSYLHAMRPDGTDLGGVALPETCSPEFFASDGRTLACWNPSVDGPSRYGVQRNGTEWRRVSMPDELKLPDWTNHYEEVDAAKWDPARERIAFVRPVEGYNWFSGSGKVTVADADGSSERIVAQNGEVPKWSPDGKRLAFARCKVFEVDWVKDEFADRTAECSLWTVPVDGTGSPELLVEDAVSPPVWSPDGRFVAFLRHSGSCATFCRSRVFIVASKGGESHEVGPELVELSESWPSELWPSLVWLPESAPIVVPAREEAPGDEFELQRCVDIWNRARMHPWPTGAVNVSLVRDRCQITVSDYGAICTQSAEMPFRFWCPSHGAGLHMLPPEYRVWNAHGGEDGTISLFDAPKGRRLPLPKAPPYPLLDGWVIPYGKDGTPLTGLKLSKVKGGCDEWTVGGYPLPYPDGYRFRCGWDDSGSLDCFGFKHPGRLKAGDTFLCPEARWEEPYDPLRFVEVTQTDWR